MKLLSAILVIFAALATFDAAAQPRNMTDKSFYYDLGKKFYCEVRLLPTENPDSARAVAFFKFTKDLLVFEKAEIEDYDKGNFVAYPKVEIEFKDEEGIIRKRELWQDTLWAETFEETADWKNYVYGGIHATLPAGETEIEIQISDKKNLRLARKEILREVTPYQIGEVISQPFFLYEHESHGVLYPFLLEGGPDFSNREPLLYFIVSFKSDFANYDLKIESTQKPLLQAFWPNDFDIELNESPEFFKTLAPYSDSKRAASYEIIDLPNNFEDKYKIGLLKFDLSALDLFPGYYNYFLQNNETKDSLKGIITVIWEDMPLSLRNPEYAVDKMRYILTEKEHGKMKAGDAQKEFEKLIEYWNEKDPTPGTRFNEKMNQYFQRVDYAFFNFQTVQEQDGAETERGKIYILKGMPDDIEETSIDGAQAEIWSFDKLDEKYVFKAVSPGNYRLVEVRESD